MRNSKLLILLLWFIFLSFISFEVSPMEFPVQGLTQDVCRSFEYLVNGNTCTICPPSCESCFLDNFYLFCSSCAEGYFYYSPTYQCVNQCGEGTRTDISIKQCLNCSVLFCLECNEETTSTQSCSKCKDGYYFDPSCNHCMKDCEEYELFDVQSGECVSSCGDDKMQDKDMCISNVSCPNIQRVQNVCSISKIIQVLYPSDDSKLLIVIGLIEINVFSLPNFILTLTHTLNNAYTILQCIILQSNQEIMYCYNSAEQIVQFTISDLKETVIVQSKGFFRGESGLLPCTFSSQIIIATSNTVLQKIDISSSSVVIHSFDDHYLSSINTGTYWKERDLVIAVGEKQNDLKQVLFLMSSDSSVVEISLNTNLNLINPSRILSIDMNQIIMYNSDHLVACQVQIQTAIQSSNDFLCSSQLVNFSLSPFYGDLQLFKPSNQVNLCLFIIHSPLSRTLNVLDCSNGYQNTQMLFSSDNIIGYTTQNSTLFLTTTKSNIRVLSFTQQPTQSGGLISTTYTEIQSITLTSSVDIFLQNLLFFQNRLIFYDQYEIFTVDLTTYLETNLNNIGESARILLSQSTNMIEIKESSKCAKHYGELTVFEAIKEDIPNIQHAYAIYIHLIQVVAKFQVPQVGLTPFQINFDRKYGYIQQTIFYSQYRLLVLMQTNQLNIIDLNTQRITYTMNNYQYEQGCFQIKFIDNQSLSIAAFDTQQSKEIITIFVLSTQQTVIIPITSDQYYYFFRFPTAYIYIGDYLTQIITKYNSKGEIVTTFPSNISKSNDITTAIFDNDTLITVSRLTLSINFLDLNTQITVLDFPIPSNFIQGCLTNVFYFNSLIYLLLPINDNELTLYSFTASGTVNTIKYLCPGSATQFQDLEYFSDGNYVVVKSPDEAIFCVIDLTLSTIQYLENEPSNVDVNTFVSSSNEVFMYLSRKGLTEVYSKKTIIKTTNPKLIKIMDIQANCKYIKEYDKSTGICVNQETDQGAVFFSFQNPQNVDLMPISFEVTRIKYFDSFFVLFGKYIASLSKKQITLFEYYKPESEANGFVINDVFFNQNTRSMIILWNGQFIQHFDTAQQKLVNEFTDMEYFLTFSETLQLLVYAVMTDFDAAIPVSQVYFYNITDPLQSYNIDFEQDSTYFQPSLQESSQVLFLLRNNIIFRIDLKTGIYTSKYYQLLTNLPIKNIISTTNTLVILPVSMENALVIDSSSLLLLLNPSLLPTSSNTSASSNYEIDYSLVATGSNYIILNISYILQIVVLSLPSLETIQTIQFHMKYKILDIDQPNNLLCILSTDSFLFVYQYSSSLSSTTSTNSLPLYSISLAEYLSLNSNYKGATFLETVQVKMFTKYKILISCFDNTIRIHSLEDGSLRQLIQENNVIISFFLVYLNNFLLSYGNQEIRVYNIASALFMNQDIVYMPFRLRSFKIPIANSELLSDYELTQVQVQPFPMQYENSSKDPEEQSRRYSIGERVYMEDIRYSKQINADFLLKEKDTNTLSTTRRFLDDTQVSSPEQSLVYYEQHRVYYISRSLMLFGVKGNQIFKSIQLNKDLNQQTIDKYFFVSRDFIAYINTDKVTIFSLKLELISITILDSCQIQRILAVPSEINSNNFIFISNIQTICRFNLVSASITTISSISTRGNLQYYHFLESSSPSSSSSTRLLFIGFADNSILSLNLVSFIGVFLEPSLSLQIYTQIFQSTTRFFASSTHIYLLVYTKQAIAISFSIQTTLNSQQLNESTLSFNSIIQLDASKTIDQFFFDSFNNRIIFFSKDTSYIQYAAITYNTSTSQESFLISISNVLKPSYSNVKLYISQIHGVYVFYGDMFIIMVHYVEMKSRVFISDSRIKGIIKNLFAVTEKLLIVSTSSAIYSIVSLPPENSSSSLYLIANIIEIIQPTIIFYRYQYPRNYNDLINVVLEGVSEEGAFSLTYPVSLHDEQHQIPCSVVFSFSTDKMYSKLFIDQLNSIQELNTIVGHQTYQIKNFHMRFVDGVESYYSYLNGKFYDFFRMQGVNDGIALYILPWDDFSDITGKNYHLQKFVMIFYMDEIYRPVLTPNKIFSVYLSFIMEDILFPYDNYGYQFTFHSIEYVLLKKIVFLPQKLYMDISLAPKGLYNQTNSQRILEETKYDETQQLLFSKYSISSFCTFWNISDTAMFTDLRVYGIELIDFSSMYAFLDCNQVVFTDIELNQLSMNQRYYAEQQVMLFMKISTLHFANGIFNNVKLNDVGMFKFLDIGKLTVSNITIANVECAPASSTSQNPPFLFDFQGVESLTIDGLRMYNITNCFIFNAQMYELENINKLNSDINLKNIVLDNVTFTNMKNFNVIQGLRTNRRLKQNQCEECHEQDITIEDIKDQKSNLAPPSRIISASADPLQFNDVKIYTPSLISVVGINISVENLTISSWKISYTTLISLTSEILNFNIVTITQSTLFVPSKLTYPAHAVTLLANSISGSSITSLNNIQVDYYVTSTISATVNNLNFTGNKNYLYNYKGDVFGLISFQNTPLLEISNSIFEQNIGQVYSSGPLNLFFITQFTITNCDFLNNVSAMEYGGAIAILFSSGQTNSITDCKFEDNSAPQHSGGAIYALSSDFNLQNCQFSGNSALIGGAIRVSSSDFYKSFHSSYQHPSNTYSFNSASVYGKNVGLYPSKLVISNSTYDSDDALRTSSSTLSLADFKSGGVLSGVSLIVFDNEGRGINFNGYKSSAHATVVEEISKFTLTFSTSNNTNIFIPQGSISLNSTTNYFDIYLNLYITPPNSETINIYTPFTYPTIQESTQSFVFQALTFKLNITSRLCKQGEIYQAINSVYECLECPEGKYSFEIPYLNGTNSGTCKICPAQAQRCILNQIQLLNGYWRENSTSDDILTCTKKTMSCFAEDPNSRELCSEGSIGPLCQSCDTYGRVWNDSYARFADSSCRKCSQMIIAYLMLLLLFLTVLSYVLMLVWKNCKAIEQKIKAITIIKLGLVRMGRSAIFDQFTTLSKIFMNYLQFIFILTDLDFNLSSYVQYVEIGGDPVFNILHSVDCFLASMSGINIIYWRIIWIFLFAFVLASIVTVVFLLAYFMLLRRIKNSKRRKLLEDNKQRKEQQVESQAVGVQIEDQTEQALQKNTRSLSIHERKREKGDDQEDYLGIEGGNVSECNAYNNNNMNNNENMLIQSESNMKHTGLFLTCNISQQTENTQNQTTNKDTINCKIINLHNIIKKQKKELTDKGTIQSLQGDENPIEAEEEINLTDEGDEPQESQDKNNKINNQNINLDLSQKPQQTDNIHIKDYEQKQQQDYDQTEQKSCIDTNKIVFDEFFRKRREKYSQESLQSEEIDILSNEENPSDNCSLSNLKSRHFLHSLQQIEMSNIPHQTNLRETSYLEKPRIFQKSGNLHFQDTKPQLDLAQSEDPLQAMTSSLSAERQQNQRNKIFQNKNKLQRVPKNIFDGSASQLDRNNLRQLEKNSTSSSFDFQSKYFQWYSGYIWMSMKLLFFYLQPGIAKMLIGTLSCVQIGSKRYIYADPQFLCEGSYQQISIFLILPLLLGICFVVPLFLLIQLRKFKKKQSSYTFLKSYGFFFQEYKNKAYYWEILRMSIKTLISCVLVFYSSSVALKLILAILIIAFYIFIQLKVQPYKTKSFNELDYLSNAVVVMSLILGLLITSTDILWLRIIAGIAISGINALFICRICKESLLTITLPCEPERRSLMQRMLFFLHIRIPVIFGLISVQKPYSCKIFIMWKKLSLYVHFHKDLLIQESQSIQLLSNARQMLADSIRIGKNNELEISKPLFVQNSQEDEADEGRSLKGTQINEKQKLKVFNEKLLEQLKNMQQKGTTQIPLKQSKTVDLRQLNAESVQSIEFVSAQSIGNQDKTDFHTVSDQHLKQHSHNQLQPSSCIIQPSSDKISFQVPSSHCQEQTFLKLLEKEKNPGNKTNQVSINEIPFDSFVKPSETQLSNQKIENQLDSEKQISQRRPSNMIISHMRNPSTHKKNTLEVPDLNNSPHNRTSTSSKQISGSRDSPSQPDITSNNNIQIPSLFPSPNQSFSSQSQQLLHTHGARKTYIQEKIQQNRQKAEQFITNGQINPLNSTYNVNLSNRNRTFSSANKLPGFNHLDSLNRSHRIESMNSMQTDHVDDHQSPSLLALASNPGSNHLFKGNNTFEFSNNQTKKEIGDDQRLHHIRSQSQRFNSQLYSHDSLFIPKHTSSRRSSCASASPKNSFQIHRKSVQINMISEKDNENNEILMKDNGISEEALNTETEIKQLKQAHGQLDMMQLLPLEIDVVEEQKEPQNEISPIKMNKHSNKNFFLLRNTTNNLKEQNDQNEDDIEENPSNQEQNSSYQKIQENQNLEKTDSNMINNLQINQRDIQNSLDSKDEENNSKLGDIQMEQQSQNDKISEMSSTPEQNISKFNFSKMTKFMDSKPPKKS